jgi:hypothetical protein
MADNSAIGRRGQFLRWDSPRGVPSLGIETKQLRACVLQAKTEKIQSVFGSAVFGFEEDDLDFLRELTQVQHVWFFDVSLHDVSGLYALTRLKSFGVHPKRPPIDFGKFSKLESMVWVFNQKDVGIDAAPSLKNLDVWHYNPKHKSFEGITIPKWVERLDISWANPRDLSGLPRLPKLRRLEFHRCRNLASLDGIDKVAPHLEELIVTTSSRVRATPDFSRMKQLKWAIIDGEKVTPVARRKT